MSKVRNILFIMCDQLRWDYLSCYGHPSLKTPNIDALARKGVRFTKAYVQSPTCGPSRMSVYTGRYVSSHRSYGNYVPLPVDEMTWGDYLKPKGMQVAVVGKTHVEPNYTELKRLGIPPESERGRFLLAGGFHEIDRHDGVLADPNSEEAVTNAYSRFLREQGYEGDNLWLDQANSAAGDNGEVLNGWQMRYANLPARVKEEHSETAYTTTRAIEFIESRGEDPWCLHLSYIKPHWPYVAPAPYHDMYTASDVIDVVRHPDEKRNPHPLYASYMQHMASREFSRDQVRDTVIPVYMGLVKQIDDHLGRLFAFLEKAGRMEDTMIIFTSDHGDYLGDHWLGEKELYHEAANRIPLIIYNPDERWDRTRDTVCDSFVEAIDILPTILDTLNVQVTDERLEGHSLLPLLEGTTPEDWRDRVHWEFDYSFRGITREDLGRQPHQCSTFVIRTDRWKYVHVEGFPPILFDLETDPNEFHDLGRDPAYKPVCDEFLAELLQWKIARKTRTTASADFVRSFLDDPRFNKMAIGQW